MRGDIFLKQEVAPVMDSQAVGETAKQPEAVSNLQDNMKSAVTIGSIWFWLILLGLYLAWDWVQNREKVQEALEPSNIRANIHNLTVIGLAAVIFINGMNVLLTKLASMRIPVLSKVAGSLLPLFHL